LYSKVTKKSKEVKKAIKKTQKVEFWFFLVFSFNPKIQSDEHHPDLLLRPTRRIFLSSAIQVAVTESFRTMSNSMQDPKKRRFGIREASRHEVYSPTEEEIEAYKLDLLRAVEEEGLDKEEGGFSHHGGALHVNARSELTQP
jgi:hypothetical protein